MLIFNVFYIVKSFVVVIIIILSSYNKIFLIRLVASSAFDRNLASKSLIRINVNYDFSIRKYEIS